MEEKKKISKEEEARILEAFKEKNWNEIVVKPTISGAAKNTYRLKKEDIRVSIFQK